MQGEPKSAEVKARAKELGFDLCGIARAHPVDPSRLDKWFANGWDASLEYVRRRRDERLDPSLLVPSARSVIVLAVSYAPAPEDPQPKSGELVVARYARGRDYHNVFRKPLRRLAEWLRSQGGEVYCETDTGAILEKYWAQEAGIGWIGKNGCLIHERLGSWLLLSALVTDLPLEADAPHPDRCGDCALCMPACPTQAFPEPRYVDARKCIAFHTIEHRGPIAPELTERFGDRLFGCDVCQEVCPWNRHPPPRKLVQLTPRTPSLAAEEVLALTPEEARRTFEGTPLARAGLEGLTRTLLALRPEARATPERPGRVQREGNVTTAPFGASSESK